MFKVKTRRGWLNGAMGLDKTSNPTVGHGPAALAVGVDTFSLVYLFSLLPPSPGPI